MRLEASALGLADGAAVDSWSSTTGTGVTASQSDATMAPTFAANAINGSAAVRFDGAGDHLNLSSNLFAPAATPRTVFTAFSSNDFRGHVVGSASATNNDFTSDGFALGVAADKPFFKAATNGEGVWLLAPADPADVGPKVVGARISDTASELITACNRVATTAMPSLGSGDMATIGGSIYPAEAFAGDIAEVLVYDRWLTDEETASVREYLTGRYGAASADMIDGDNDGTFDACDMMNTVYIGADAVTGITLEAPATLRGGVVANIVDAPSALSFDPHTDDSHVWGQVEPVSVLLELDNTYYIEQMHFWNFTGEGYDVDSITASFYSGDALVKEVTVQPETGFESILAEDFVINAAGVTSIRLVLSATNNESEFQNVGFTGWVQEQE